MTAEQAVLDLIDRIAPVYIPIISWEDGTLDAMLVDRRDRKLIACATSWEFLDITGLTEAGKKLRP